MKAFILAAGNGTRLHPLTARIPKCLVPIRGTPLLRIWLDICELHGIDEATVNLHAHPAAVRGYIDTCRTNVKVRFSEEPALLGSAGTLRANADWIGHDPEFFVFYGDVLTTLDLEQMLRFHRSGENPVTIALHPVENPSECGIATVDSGGVVRSFVEKPSDPHGNLGFCGLMIAKTSVLSHIPPGVADIGYHLLPKFVGQMSGYVIHEYLTDIGTLGAYERAQREWPGLGSSRVSAGLVKHEAEIARDQRGFAR